MNLDYSRINGLLWILVILGPFIVIKRILHRELQSVLYIVTRRVDITYVLFYVIFLPGVLLHELSHYLMALLLRVKTGRISVIPRNLGNGRLQLGFVETSKSDILRDGIIGFAPLLAGGIFVGYVGIYKMSLLSLWGALNSKNLSFFIQTLTNIQNLSDFWLWFYLTFTISSIMLPSESDRRTWMPLSLLIGLFVVLGILVGVGPWMLDSLWEPINNLLLSCAIIFAMSAMVHFFVLLPIYGIRKIFNRIVS